MIYITFERGDPKVSNTTARRLGKHNTAASVESKMATMQHKIFCVREFIKTESATAVQRAFIFVSTFNLQRGRAFVVGITNLNKQAVCVKAKAQADHVYQRRT